MKYINEGFYYRVYEFDTGRVSKKFQSYWFCFKKIYALERERGSMSFIQAIISANKSVIREKKALLMMKDKLFLNIPLFLFGNPSFVGNTLNYTQDKVMVLGDFLTKNNIEKNKKILDDYFGLQKKFWSYGLHDKTYKFQSNYGIDNQGNVVCIDFGEFVFTEEEALKSVSKQRWLFRQSYRNWQDNELKTYYTEHMSMIMTADNLSRIWATKLTPATRCVAGV